MAAGEHEDIFWKLFAFGAGLRLVHRYKINYNEVAYPISLHHQDKRLIPYKKEKISFIPFFTRK